MVSIFARWPFSIAIWMTCSIYSVFSFGSPNTKRWACSRTIWIIEFPMYLVRRKHLSWFLIAIALIGGSHNIPYDIIGTNCSAVKGHRRCATLSKLFLRVAPDKLTSDTLHPLNFSKAFTMEGSISLQPRALRQILLILALLFASSHSLGLEREIFVQILTHFSNS